MNAVSEGKKGFVLIYPVTRIRQGMRDRWGPCSFIHSWHYGIADQRTGVLVPETGTMAAYSRCLTEEIDREVGSVGYQCGVWRAVERCGQWSTASDVGRKLAFVPKRPQYALQVG